MSELFGEQLSKSVECYLGDISVHSKSTAEHATRVGEGIQKLIEVGFKFNKKIRELRTI